MLINLWQLFSAEKLNLDGPLNLYFSLCCMHNIILSNFTIHNTAVYLLVYIIVCCNRSITIDWPFATAMIDEIQNFVQIYNYASTIKE